MFKKFMDETENNITSDEFKRLGEMTENYSGSDISVVLRDALMAPVRTCQSAKQFILTDVGAWRPVVDYPSCSKCPINLSDNPSTGKICDHCDARCITLEDIPDPTLLEVPVVTFKDVCDSINRNSSSVSNYELEKYSFWTETYGQDGN
jgi:vacuolar protein-sorting-associated protein 4